MFVVDVSASMAENAPGTAVSKWEATRDALRATITEVSPDVGMGIVFFPNYPAPGPQPRIESASDPSAARRRRSARFARQSSSSTLCAAMILSAMWLGTTS